MYDTLLRKAYEERANVLNEVRATIDAAEAEKRDITAEENEANARREARMSELEAEIQRYTARIAGDKVADEARELLARSTSAQRQENGDRPTDDQMLRSLLKATGSTEFRTDPTIYAVGISGQGGSTVPTGFLPRLIEQLYTNSAVLQLGPTVIRTSNGDDLRMPRKTTRGTATITPEATAATLTTGGTDSVTFKATKFTAASQYSKELYVDSAIDVVGLIVNDHALAIANGTGHYFVNGSGSGEPQGFLADTDVTGHALATGKTKASDITFDDVIALYHALAQPYRANIKWSCNDSTLAVLRTLKDGFGRYLWEPSVQAGSPDTLFARPIITTPEFPEGVTANAGAKVLAVGNWEAGLAVREVNGVTVTSDTSVGFLSGLVTVMTEYRCDSRVIDPRAIKVLSLGAASA